MSPGAIPAFCTAIFRVSCKELAGDAGVGSGERGEKGRVGELCSQTQPPKQPRASSAPCSGLERCCGDRADRPSAARPGGDDFLYYYLLLNSDLKPTCLSWFCSPQSAAAAPSPVLGNIPPNDGMPGGPIPPGFFQVGCRSSRRPRRRGARVCSRLAAGARLLSPRGPRPSSTPTQLTRLGITRGLPSSHLRFLVSVA